MSMHAQNESESATPLLVRPVVLRYELPGFFERWTLSEEPVPESAWHDACLELLKALLVAWVRRTGHDAAVYRNLAVRVRQDQPKVGFDPDLCVVEPIPPEADDLDSLLLWRPEHRTPLLVIEVVAPHHPYKDYAETPEKCAALGVSELVVFDPKLAGPRAGGGPHLIQLWRRQQDASFVRIHAASSPVFSPLLGAFWQPIDERRRLGISDDREGTRPWLTAEQTERAAKDDALRRVAELEAELTARR
jgi:Uma2 family endonuclease